jgi:hypothetical protein
MRPNHRESRALFSRILLSVRHPRVMNVVTAATRGQKENTTCSILNRPDDSPPHLAIHNPAMHTNGSAKPKISWRAPAAMLCSFPRHSLFCSAPSNASNRRRLAHEAHGEFGGPANTLRFPTAASTNKFLRLRHPVPLGHRIDEWRVCWLGGWDRGHLFFVVIVEAEPPPVRFASTSG